MQNFFVCMYVLHIDSYKIKLNLNLAMYDSFNIPVEGKITLSVKTQTDGVKLSSVLRHSESRIVRKLCHRDAAKSLARPGRKQTNVSFGMA